MGPSVIPSQVIFVNIIIHDLLEYAIDLNQNIL
nr:MAG TPA: hypothetical protein [Caudoviricetes sp.]